MNVIESVNNSVFRRTINFRIALIYINKFSILLKERQLNIYLR